MASRIPKIDAYNFIDEGQPLCAETDPELFFLDKGDSPVAARKICAVCELAEPCLTAAVRNNEEFGVWGGATRRQREHIKTAEQIRQFVADLRKYWGPKLPNTNKLRKRYTYKNEVISVDKWRLP